MRRTRTLTAEAPQVAHDGNDWLKPTFATKDLLSAFDFDPQPRQFPQPWTPHQTCTLPDLSGYNGITLKRWRPALNDRRSWIKG